MENVNLEQLNQAFNQLLHRFYDLNDENKQLKYKLQQLSNITPKANKSENVLQNRVANTTTTSTQNNNSLNATAPTTNANELNYGFDDSLKDDCTPEDMDKINNLLDSFKQ